MLTMPNIALLTECRLLSDSLAINMSLLRSEEQEETIWFHLRQSPALRDFLMESFDSFQLVGPSRKVRWGSHLRRQPPRSLLS